LQPGCQRSKCPSSAVAADDLPYKGDTVIGNDVWLGYESLIMPGVKIGNGAIVSSRAVVVSDVPPYTMLAVILQRPSSGVSQQRQSTS
jgi:acetyltransferase-like isoleucine patch superfamily enzyme